MPEPFRFSTPSPLSCPIISVMTYLHKPNMDSRPHSRPKKFQADPGPGAGGTNKVREQKVIKQMSRTLTIGPEVSRRASTASVIIALPTKDVCLSGGYPNEMSPCLAYLQKPSRIAFGLQRDREGHLVHNQSTNQSVSLSRFYGYRSVSHYTAQPLLKIHKAL